MVHDSLKSEIMAGQYWIHKKTKRAVRVEKTPETKFDPVRITHIHTTGRTTKKQQHYFLYEYELVSP